MLRDDEIRMHLERMVDPFSFGQYSSFKTKFLEHQQASYKILGVKYCVSVTAVPFNHSNC